MKTKIELDKDDMKKIIAEHFSVNEDRVTVGAKEMCVGYGMMEHNESVPFALLKRRIKEKSRFVIVNLENVYYLES